MINPVQTTQVWDLFIRVFHWSLVLSYAIAWGTAEEFAWLHEQAGYYILVLIGLRIVWGLIGTHHARFVNFVRSPALAIDYLRSLTTRHPRRYLGHNPAAGWMIIALLISLSLCAITGIYMTEDEGILEELHEGLANLTLLLVMLHVGGVLLSSLAHGENLVRSMWTGKKAQDISHAMDE